LRKTILQLRFQLLVRGNFQGKQMLRDAPIRTKLIAIFVLPALGTAMLAALRIAGDFRVGLRADREKRATVVALETAALTHALGAERDASVAWLVGQRAGGARPEVLTTRLRVDRAIWELRRDTAGLSHSGRDPSLGSRLQAAVAELGGLAATRQSIDRRATVASTMSSYSTTIGHLLDVAARLPTDIGHRGLARDLDALMALAQAEESASFERGLGTAVATVGRFRGQDYLRLAASVGARQRELAHFQATATAAQQRLYSSSVQAPRVEQADDLEALLLGAERAPRLEVFPEQWSDAAGERVEALRAVSQQLGAQALRTNRANVVAAEQQLLNNLLLFMIVVVLTFALAVFLGRSMINPLIELEQAAREVAERKLPSVVERLHLAQTVDFEAETEPIEVRAGGEIGRVAEAFSAVQRVAVGVAVDQAALRQSVSEMFVNMARRSQSLIDRQLALIDQLEKNETDPDQLDQFFRLDHLATRMRRNAESLLVLSGSEPGRRWSQPVPLANLARAAVAEVEDYTRVQVLPMDGVELSGPAGIDLVHLLAELIENATAFSPPDTSVVIAGEGLSNGYLIEIEDRGIGMSDADLHAANERLASPPAADLALSRMLGFYVIGRLAQRCGIKVQLRHSPYGGVTAQVLLPAPMVAGAGEPARGAASQGGQGPFGGPLRPLPGRGTIPARPLQPAPSPGSPGPFAPSVNGHREQRLERHGPAPPPATGPDGQQDGQGAER